jgi:metal-responsive CopG/Arc/MetJ family transcriptional regulator
MTKTAISVPAALLAEVDRAARRRGKSRSQFVQALLVQAVRAMNDAEFTESLNSFFSGAQNRAAHRSEASAWRQLNPAWEPEQW